MKTTMGVVHVIAHCRDCEWSSTNYTTAQKDAARHAKKKAHIVSIEVGRAGIYDGKSGGLRAERLADSK